MSAPERDCAQAPPRYKWAALAVVMVGTFMAVLDASIVNVALPHLMRSFGVDVDGIRWVVTLYMVTFAIVTLATNHLRHVFGLRRLYLAGLLVFTAGSALCGFAWDLPSLCVFRVLQALGGGVLFPAGLIVISECFAPRERGTAFGTFGVVIVFAPTLGPTVGGYLADSFSWRSIFTVNIPVGLVAFAAAWRILRPGERDPGRDFDRAGFTGLSLAIVGLLAAFTDGWKMGWGSPYILACLAAVAGGLALTVRAAREARHPVVDPGLLRNPAFVTICLVNTVRAVALHGRIFLLPIFMQGVGGYSAVTSGWLLAPGAFVSGLASPLFGVLADRVAPRPFILGGFALTGISMLAYADLSPATSLSSLLWPQLVFGLGMGMMNAPLTSTAMNAVRADQLGMVSGLLSVIMQVAGAFGVALLGAGLAWREAARGAAAADRAGSVASAAAFGECFAALAAVCAVGFLVALTLRRGTG